MYNKYNLELGNIAIEAYQSGSDKLINEYGIPKIMYYYRQLEPFIDNGIVKLKVDEDLLTLFYITDRIVGRETKLSLDYLQYIKTNIFDSEIKRKKVNRLIDSNISLEQHFESISYIFKHNNTKFIPNKLTQLVIEGYNRILVYIIANKYALDEGLVITSKYTFEFNNSRYSTTGE